MLILMVASYMLPPALVAHKTQPASRATGARPASSRCQPVVAQRGCGPSLPDWPQLTVINDSSRHGETHPDSLHGSLIQRRLACCLYGDSPVDPRLFAERIPLQINTLASTV
jgi:hypothetical protein